MSWLMRSLLMLALLCPFSTPSAEAYYGPRRPVVIDVAPFDPANVLDLSRDEKVGVAILSGRGFHPRRDIQPSTLTFGETGDEQSFVYCDYFWARDLNRDRTTDLICYFRAAESGLSETDTEAILKGGTYYHSRFQGRDRVKVLSREATAMIVPDVALELKVTTQKVCSWNISHVVWVGWEIQHSGHRSRLELKAVTIDGSEHQKRFFRKRGKTLLPVKAELGTQLYVVGSVKSGRGETTRTIALSLEPCVEPPTPDPANVFRAPPSPPTIPPIITDNPGRLKEVDIAYVQGTPNTDSTRFVSAVGTGGSTQLSSWTIDIGTNNPIHLHDSDIILGHQVNLHTLTPGVGPNTPFLSGVIRDGKLWLTSWRLDNNGVFQEVFTHGYGEDIDVKHYDIAHTQLTISGDVNGYEVVTPVLTSDDKIRLVTWFVNEISLQIFGLQDSGDITASPSADPSLSVEALPEATANDFDVDNVDFKYVLSFRNDNDRLSHILWDTINGFSFVRGGGTSGLDIRGNSTIVETVGGTKVLPLTRGGFVTTSSISRQANMSVWDFHKPGFEVIHAVYKITDDSMDQQFGIGLDTGPPPTPTNGSAPEVQGGATQNARTRLTDELWELEGFNIGDGEVVSVNHPPNHPFGEFTSIGIASVTKVMTLLLAIEAVRTTALDYSDEVEVSANAATTGGSTMNLGALEKQSLENLIYGMMIRSGNDASVAIAEYVEAELGWDFLQMMNDKAADLDMTATSYNQVAGGSYSTPQDQITLFKHGTNHPVFGEDFRKFSTDKFHSACGETGVGDPICRNLTKFSDSGYPGLQGWKNGNLGFHDAAKKDLGVPLCTSCLLARTTRAARSMIAGIQQSGDRWGDSSAMYDFGFIDLFTPDWRGSDSNSFGFSNIIDAAVDKINDGFSVTGAVVENGGLDTKLQIKVWQTNADLGQINQLDDDTTLRAFAALAAGAAAPMPGIMDGARISTLLHEGDYITLLYDTGFRNFKLKLWRLGPKEP